MSDEQTPPAQPAQPAPQHTSPGQPGLQIDGMHPEAPQSSDGTGNSDGTFESLESIIASMSAGEEPDGDAQPTGEGDAPQEGQGQAPEGEQPSEEQPAQPGDDRLEVERYAEAAWQAREAAYQLEQERQARAALEQRIRDAEPRLKALERLQEDPLGALQDLGLKFDELTKRALADPAQNQVARLVQEQQRQLQEVQQQLATWQAERTQMEEQRAAHEMVTGQSTRWPTLAGNPKAGEAIYREYYNRLAKGQQASPEVIADELERDLRTYSEFVQWQKQRDAGGQTPAPQQPAAQPQGQQAPAAQQPPEQRDTPRGNGASEVAPHEAGATGMDDWEAFERAHGRKPRPGPEMVQFILRRMGT